MHIYMAHGGGAKVRAAVEGEREADGDRGARSRRQAAHRAVARERGRGGGGAEERGVGGGVACEAAPGLRRREEVGADYGEVGLVAEGDGVREDAADEGGPRRVVPGEGQGQG